MAWQEPISTTYRGRAVYEAPPNSSGHVLLQELNLIEHFDMASLGLTTAEAIHAPRWTHFQGRTGSAYPHKETNDMIIESRVDPGVVGKLAQRGHPVRAVDAWGGRGSAGAIRIDESGAFLAASDPRRDGQALVY